MILLCNNWYADINILHGFFSCISELSMVTDATKTLSIFKFYFHNNYVVKDLIITMLNFFGSITLGLTICGFFLSFTYTYCKVTLLYYQRSQLFWVHYSACFDQLFAAWHFKHKVPRSNLDNVTFNFYF